MSAESNDRWGGCNCDQCVADRAAVARVLAATQKSRTTLRREAAQRGEEPPEFDGADTVRPDEADGIEAVRRYRRERKNQHSEVPACDCGADLGHGDNCSYQKYIDETNRQKRRSRG